MGSYIQAPLFDNFSYFSYVKIDGDAFAFKIMSFRFDTVRTFQNASDRWRGENAF